MAIPKFIDVNVSIFRARATRSYPNTNVLNGTSVEGGRVLGGMAVRVTAVGLTHRRGVVENNADHRIIGALARTGGHMSRRRTLHYDIGCELSR